MSDSAEVFGGAALTNGLSKMQDRLISVYSGEIRMRCILKTLAEQKCIKRCIKRVYSGEVWRIRKLALNKNIQLQGRK